MQRYDAAIAGGGPAGCACAIRLAQRGHSVLIVGRAPSRRQPGDALPPAANRFLRELGVTAQFLADGHLPCFGTSSAWGSGELWSTDFIHHPDGHGWHTDRVRFDRMLQRAAADAGVEIWTEAAAVEWSEIAGGGWGIVADRNGRPAACEATWLVDCTGKSSAVARSVGVKRRVYDRLVGFIAVFETGCSGAGAESATLVESAPHGWWYTARLPGDCRVAMYFTDAAGKSFRLARSRTGFEQLLRETEHVRERLSGCAMRSPLVAMPANSSVLEQVHGERWLAAGDAAAAHDPLSSMGLGSALCGGIRAADAVSGALSGDAAAVARYATAVYESFDAYRVTCASVYAEERRWPGNPFWKSRASGLRGR